MTQNLLVNEIRALVDAQDRAALARTIGLMHPAAAAAAVAELSEADGSRLLELLPHDSATALFTQLERDDQKRLVVKLSPALAKSLISDMPHDDRVDLVQALPDADSQRIMASLDAQERSDIERLRRYADGTAGAAMTTDFAALDEGMTVGEAIAHVRTIAAKRETIYYLYVLDADRRLAGVITLRDMIMADPATPVRDVMRRELVTCRVEDDVKHVSRVLKEYDLIALPVINGNDAMAGIVTFDDVIDLIEEEASDTMYWKAGVGDLTHSKDHIYSEKLTAGPIGYSVRTRILFLLVTLIGGLLVGGLIDTFEETLAAVLAAAVFIPLIMDMGGNVGTQSTTIFARGYALGHIDPKRFVRRHLLREGAIGAVMGLMLGTAGGTVAYFWQGVPNGIPQLGIAVGVSLFVVTTLASMLGFLLPWVMTKIGVDHAPGADPFITTIKDFTGLALYFFLVATLIGVPDDPEEAAEAVAALTAVIP